MRSKSDPPKPRTQRRWPKFGLRALFLIILLAASYSAGWVSHRAWQQRHMRQTITEAIRQINDPVQVEQVNDLLILRGSKRDVDKMQKAISEIEGTGEP